MPAMVKMLCMYSSTMSYFEVKNYSNALLGLFFWDFRGDNSLFLWLKCSHYSRMNSRDF